MILSIHICRTTLTFGVLLPVVPFVPGHSGDELFPESFSSSHQCMLNSATRTEDQFQKTFEQTQTFLH